ncbi:hypothetical protein BGI40_03750 [Snodgrassella communis]|nr:hypothetical protein BGI29_01480 [Snodgrassella communis]PIT26969.1 hypothetical protein BGI39_09070 [Snodgrassella communis]PIT27571.1 hypothetical protein BGI38_05495 [Snodgrassella communis]PIT34988.1 hypothetical protein BGI40_03750 [Snodgrassella communis]
MNGFIKQLLSAIGETETTSVSHNFIQFKIEGKITSLNDNIIEKLYQTILLTFEKGITLEIELRLEESNSVRLSNGTPDTIKEKIQEILEELDLEEPILPNFSFGITIEWENSNLNIFSWEEFHKHLNKTPLETAFKQWSYLIADNTYATIRVWDEENNIENDFFSFIHYSQISQDNKKAIDQTKIENRDKVSHFVNACDIIIVPDSFDFASNNWPLAAYFNNLRNILSLIFLSDYSRIIANEVAYCIKGYKTVNGKLNEQLTTDVGNELWSMYKWAYERGSFIDKIGILRNVIPIHMQKENINTLESGTLLSAQSGYDLYLKDNVKQYIEIKNKISDMLLSQSEKAGQITKDMFNILKTNLWTFLTFFTTTIVAKNFDKSNNDYHNTVIFAGICLIFLSAFFLGFALSEVNDEKEKLSKRYLEIEYRYKDLLNNQDIKKIIDFSSLEGSTPKEREIEYIDRKVQKYKCLWIACIVLLSIILICIGFDIF